MRRGSSGPRRGCPARACPTCRSSSSPAAAPSPAAEEFAYNLKNLKRATIVGETTGGGANPADSHRVKGYPVVMSLPFGRAINPISGTNWEGTGVEPDVEVAAPEALAVAHERALAALAEKAEPIPRGRRSWSSCAACWRTAASPPASPPPSCRPSPAPTARARSPVEGGALWYQRGEEAQAAAAPGGPGPLPGGRSRRLPDPLRARCERERRAPGRRPSRPRGAARPRRRVARRTLQEPKGPLFAGISRR